MNIIVNGESRTIASQTISQLLQELGYTSTRIAVEYNDTIIMPEDYEGIHLSPADRLEIVCFVGGG